MAEEFTELSASKEPTQPSTVEIVYNAKEAFTRAKALFPDDKSEVFILPYGAESARWIGGKEGQYEVGMYTHQLSPELYLPKDQFDHPVMYAKFDYVGVKGTAVCLSEEGVKPFAPYEGTRQFYRFIRLSELPSVLRNGYYQVPGRVSFFTDARHNGWLSEDRVAIAFELNHAEVIAGTFETACLAFPAFPEQLGAKLPEELVKELGPLKFVRNNAMPRAEYGKLLNKQTLLMGHMAGMLLQVPSSRINLEASVQANEQHLKEGMLDSEKLASLIKIFEDH